MTQLEILNDKYEKVKKLHEKQNEEIFIKESESLRKLQESEEAKKSYKEKLMKYQEAMQ